MTKENLQINFNKVKDIILTILISFLFLLPLLKHIRFTFRFATFHCYDVLKIIGTIGLFLLIIKLYIDFEKSTDKKQYLKDISPILILFFYMIWTLISAFLAKNKSLAFNGTSYRLDGYNTYLAYAGCFGLAYFISSKKIKKVLLYMFVIIASLIPIFIELASHRILANVFSSIDRINASFHNSNHYGYYLLTASAVSSFLFITEKNKILKTLDFLMYLCLVYTLIINNTFGCYLALISSLVLFLIVTFVKKEDKKSVSLLVASFVILSIITNNSSGNISQNNISRLGSDISNIFSASDSDDTWKHAGSGRMEIWVYGIKFFIQNPIIGYGPENLESKYNEVGINQDRPHNLLIQLMTTSGLPGLVLYVLAIGIMIFRSFKNYDIKNSLHIVVLFSVIAYLISAMFGNSMYYTSPYFFILLGLLQNELITSSS